MAENSRIEELKRRVQMDPASIAFAALAEEYRRAGQFEAAIATCESGLQRHPAYLSARVTLGRSLMEVGRYVEAREQLDRVLQVAPENLAAIRGLAEIHHRRGELPETLEQYGSAAPPAPEPPVPAAARTTAASIELVSPPRPEPGPLEVVVAPPPATAAPVPISHPEPATPSRPSHPDADAVPALEQFLAAIVRAKESLPSHGSEH